MTRFDSCGTYQVSERSVAVFFTGNDLVSERVDLLTHLPAIHSRRIRFHRRFEDSRLCWPSRSGRGILFNCYLRNFARTVRVEFRGSARNLNILPSIISSLLLRQSSPFISYPEIKSFEFMNKYLTSVRWKEIVHQNSKVFSFAGRILYRRTFDLSFTGILTHGHALHIQSPRTSTLDFVIRTKVSRHIERGSRQRDRDGWFVVKNAEGERGIGVEKEKEKRDGIKIGAEREKGRRGRWYPSWCVAFEGDDGSLCEWRSLWDSEGAYLQGGKRGARKEDKRRKRGKIRDGEGATRKRTMGVKHPRQF